MTDSTPPRRGRPKGSKNRKYKYNHNTIAAIIRGGLIAGKSTPDILADVKKSFPDARTTAATVHNYRSQLRKKGAELKTIRISATGKKPDAKKSGTEKPTIASVIRAGLLAGKSTDAIVADVRRTFPHAKTGNASVNTQRNLMRREGHDIATVRAPRKGAKDRNPTRAARRTISAAIREALLSGKSNDAVLEAIKAEFPSARTGVNAVATQRSQLRKEGAAIPSGWESRKRETGENSHAIALGCDHAGIELKKSLKKALRKRGIPVLDFGTDTRDSVDYPDFADAVARAIAEGHATRGIVICGSGIGISIAANRHRHIRAALCTSGQMARLARQHNDANVLALGARLTGPDVALDCLEQFLDTPFEGGRHQRRINKLS